MNERHEADPGMIYLDHAATAHPRHPGVPEAMAAAIEIAGSVGRGSHGGARGATAIVGSCRERLADLFGVSDPSRMVLFPSSTLQAPDRPEQLQQGLLLHQWLLPEFRHD